MKQLPQSANRKQRVRGIEVEVNLREENGVLYLSLYDGDSVLASVKYDQDNPGESINKFISLVNLVGSEKAPVNPAQKATAVSAASKLRFRNGILEESP